ncbi:PREDICTED: retinitis pigmentosa 1-like 1 protein [Propithecus coquereli]|uniref:retinitis pigmentosa 1-like 1 protein n=1 Tax=Propithecus coquereli TaxID=379532 RepID=UPI00063F78C2|nr:PREDICTED: retinitis pigmentosa 1-like 1 protein [Propithecus coquereli]
MSRSPREAQAPSHHERLLPSVARTPSVTQVAPAKKITFLKRGDPRFVGVRLAVHQRAFKTFSALMDELSRRVPLSFGVRSVTTPRGLHGLSALEQLEDGGCYFCSDKNPPKMPGGPGRPQGRGPSAQQSRDFEGQRETPGTSSSWKGPKAPRRVLLVKNGDPRLQQTVVLSHRDTRDLTAFLSKASDILRFPVKHVYTISGKKLDSLQSLPPVLVCAGHEAFRPLAMEDARRNRTETSAGLASRNKNGSWGPKAKQSVIHARPRSGSRPRRSSLLSERSGLSDPPESLQRAWVGCAPDGHPLDTPARPGPLVASDGVKKKVRVNEDGSLDVEMKVRFHLLGEDTLLWSRRMGRACGEGPDLGEVDPLCCVWEGHPGGGSVAGAWGPRSCGVEREDACGRGGPSGPRYEIWTNPLHAARGEGLTSRRRSGLAQHPHGRGPRGQGATLRERRWDSISSASSSSHPEGSEPDSSCCPRTPEGGAGSGGLSAQSRAKREAGPCPETAGPGSQGAKGAPFDTSAGEWGGQHWGCLDEARPETSQQEVTQGGDPSSPTLSPSALRNEDLQAETCGQGTGCHQARWGSVTRLPLAPGHSGSWDTDGGSPPPPACASAQRGTRKQRTRTSAVSPPSSPGLGRVARRGHAGECHHCRDTHCLPDLPAAQPAPRPPDRGGACPEGPAARLSESSSSTQTQASGDRRAPSSGSLHSQDLPAASSATISPAGNLDCASGSFHCEAPSAGWAGDVGSRAGSPAPAPPHTPHFCSQARAGGQGPEAGGIPEPSSPLALQVGRPDPGEAGGHRGHCGLQIGASPVQGGPGGNAQALWVPSSEAAWVCSRYCPTPPRRRPCAERRPSSCGSSGRCHGAARGPGGSRQWGESPAVGCVLSPDPTGGSQGKTAAGREGPEEQEERGGVSPGALPHASPDAVVREWLGNIPEEPVLLKYEMVDEAANAAGDGPESPKEDPEDGRSPEGPGGLAQARPRPPEGDASENLEPDRALPGTGSAGPSPGEGPPQGAAPGGNPKAFAEARVGGEAAVGCGVPQGVLPARVWASAQIMKALAGFRQGRPSSLPEVSGPAARRLSRSAGALITCLARLHFFDEDLGSPNGKASFADSPRYQELLSLSRALWPGCDLGQGQPDSSLQELTWSQALPGLGSHAMTEDLTPTSSSGVDLSSGSGGSGEGSVPCAADCALGPERVELPQKTSHQRPDSRGSENAEDLGNPRPSCCPASPHSQAPGEGRAGGDGGELGLGSPPGHAVGQAMQEEGAQLEETREGMEREELQESAEEERLSEEGRVGCPGGDEGGQEEGAGRASAPAARREEPTEPPGQLGEGDPHAGEDQSGPQFEPGLEDLPGAASPLRGAGEESAPAAGRVSLDPDPVWASTMLKKMEKAFMAHLAGAVAQLRAHWSLQDHPLLDQMAAELQQDVGRRLQDSTQRELQKMLSRAGRRAPGPPGEALSREPSSQTEQRRRCLRGLRNLSAFSERTGGLGSLSLEDSAALGTQQDGVAEGEEFCPCEACVRKKVSPVSPKDTVGTSRAPIKEAFDLQQILQKRRGGCSSGDAAEGAPEKTGAEQLQEDPSSPRPSWGADDGLGLGPGVQGEEARDQGSGGSDSLEREPSAVGDQDPGGQSEGAEGVGAQEADGEGRPGSGGGTQGERGGSPLVSPQQGQSEDASENGSPDQEGRPASPPAPASYTLQRLHRKARLPLRLSPGLRRPAQVSRRRGLLCRPVRPSPLRAGGVPAHGRAL